MTLPTHLPLSLRLILSLFLSHSIPTYLPTILLPYLPTYLPTIPSPHLPLSLSLSLSLHLLLPFLPTNLTVSFPFSPYPPTHRLNYLPTCFKVTCKDSMHSCDCFSLLILNCFGTMNNSLSSQRVVTFYSSASFHRAQPLSLSLGQISSELPVYLAAETTETFFFVKKKYRFLGYL